MTASRKRMVFLLFLFIVGGHTICMLGRNEPWPFSCYPMYSRVPSQTWSVFEIRGMAMEYPNAEFVIQRRHLPRYPAIWRSLNRIISHSEDQEATGKKIDGVLLDLSKMYERDKNKGEVKSPNLRTVRLYRRTWSLSRGSENLAVRELPQELLREVEIVEVP